MRKKHSGKVVVVSIISLTIMVLTLLIVSGSAAQNTVDFVGAPVAGGPCTLLDEFQKPFTITHSIKIVGEIGEPGTILLQCDHITETSEQGAEKWNSGNTFDSNGFGTRCFVDIPGTGSSITNDWNVIVSASGNVKLTCHFGDQFD
jgi:hypothetical protein